MCRGARIRQAAHRGLQCNYHDTCRLGFVIVSSLPGA